ncbi:MAG TPA: efflux RND transporter periplasmic adaptor subunit [Candidatus Udaeobacter sp.]|jgi:HlyD family secretion protein|nr:efflux RND transporter periplasmic adaptor subunit [Candidatus Udaeobacter sp.]
MKNNSNGVLKNRRAAMIAICTAIALVFLIGCGGAEKEKEPVVTVQTTPAQRGPISQVVSAEAVVYPLEQATVAPKITSTIKKFHVQRGTHVKKGQLLAELENADLSGAALASKGDFKQAAANYVTTVSAGLPQQIQKAELDAATAKATFDAQQKVYDSRKDLFQQGAIPRRDLDSAEVALLQARSQNEQAQKLLADLQRVGKEQGLKAAEGAKESYEGRMLNAEAQLSYSRIISPIDGVVTDRPLYEGDLANANQPILTVMNTSRLIAKAHIAQSEAAILRVGNPARLKISGLDEPIKGDVTLVSPALDPGSTTIEVWVEASKPDPALKPGMTVEVAMTAKTVKDAIVVPTPAVYKNADGADYVLLAGSDGHAHLKTVQVGVRNSETTQIVSGIVANDPVISSGGYALPDKTQIKIEAAGEKDAGEKAGKGGKADTDDEAKPMAKGKE